MTASQEFVAALLAALVLSSLAVVALAEWVGRR